MGRGRRPVETVPDHGIRGLSQIIFPTVSVIMTLSLDPPPPLSVTVNIQ